MVSFVGLIAFSCSQEVKEEAVIGDVDNKEFVVEDFTSSVSDDSVEAVLDDLLLIIDQISFDTATIEADLDAVLDDLNDEIEVNMLAFFEEKFGIDSVLIDKMTNYNQDIQDMIQYEIDFPNSDGQLYLKWQEMYPEQIVGTHGEVDFRANPCCTKHVAPFVMHSALAVANCVTCAGGFLFLCPGCIINTAAAVHHGLEAGKCGCFGAG